MSAYADHAAFEALAQSGAEDNDAAQGQASRLKVKTNSEQLKALAALWLNAAAASPESLAAVYDASAQGWLGEPVGGPQVRTSAAGAKPGLIPQAFWTELWRLVAESSRMGPTGLTSRTAALGGLISPDVIARAGKVALAWPGVPKAVGLGYPKAFKAEALARCRPGSLGAQFMATEPDLQVPPRGDLPAPLSDIHARIVQARGLWRLAAGYQATALHEVALSAFQLGQLGYHYAARYLAMVLTRVAFEQPAGGPLMLQTILTAWTHGRRSPPLIEVRWETLWDKPLEAVRAQLKLTPYASPYPADLFERAAA